MNRRVSMPLYSLLIVLVFSFLSPFASVFAAVRIGEGNTQEALKREAIAAQKLQRESEENRRIQACDFLRVSLEVYEEAPPSTPAGIRLRTKYLEYYRAGGCTPKK